MNWINGLYLGSGLGLGLTAGWWLWHFKPHTAIKESQDAPNSITESLSKRYHQLELAYQMAVEMSQFKGGFLSRTAHELRSPLNGIIGVHQLILADLCEDTAEEREFIAQAHDSTLKMVQILDEVISVSRVEQGTDTLELQPVQLASVLSQIEDLTHLKAKNRNLWLTIERPDPEIYVLADPKWFRQVLLNLVNSAIDTMQQGKISLSVKSVDSDYAYVLLEDERPADLWRDPIDLLKTLAITGNSSEPTSVLFHPLKERSSGFNFLLSQTLMETMNGHLERLETSTDEPSPLNNRIQCSIPVIVSEV